MCANEEIGSEIRIALSVDPSMIMHHLGRLLTCPDTHKLQPAFAPKLNLLKVELLMLF